MTQMTISGKYQIVVPKAVRKQARIKPGQKVQVDYLNKTIVISTGDNAKKINKKALAIAAAYGPSYSALAREWNTPEEDAAWAHLQ